MQLRYRARCLVVWPGLKNNRTDKVFYLLATNQIPQYALGFAAVTHEFAVVAKGVVLYFFMLARFQQRLPMATVTHSAKNGLGDSRRRSEMLDQDLSMAAVIFDA